MGSTGTFSAAAAAWAASAAVPASAGAATATATATSLAIGFGMSLGIGSLVAAPFVAGLWLLQGTVPALPESGCPRLKKPKSHPVQQKLKNMKARQLHGTQVRAQETKGPIDKSARQWFAWAKWPEQRDSWGAPAALSNFLKRVGASKIEMGQPNLTPTLVQAAWQCETKTVGARSSRDGALADTSLIGFNLMTWRETVTRLGFHSATGHRFATGMAAARLCGRQNAAELWRT